MAVRPETALAPKARALSTSEPVRMPPSKSTVIPEFFTFSSAPISAKASRDAMAPSSCLPPWLETNDAFYAMLDSAVSIFDSLDALQYNGAIPVLSKNLEVFSTHGKSPLAISWLTKHCFLHGSRVGKDFGCPAQSTLGASESARCRLASLSALRVSSACIFSYMRLNAGSDKAI